jgi:hypothetical protein
VAIDMTENIVELRDLDAASGDGDLGVTVELSSKAMTTYLNAPDEIWKYLYYRHDTWNSMSQRDKDFGEVKQAILLFNTVQAL